MSSFGLKRKARVIKVQDDPTDQPASDDVANVSAGKLSHTRCFCLV